ncbi:MAG: CPBP family intramembrane metalloprotease [Planctomycetota bacterium]|jgi:hypothetical protein|nr:CPBP family intramembrane metalloprotease [Planctomycetota bacterium]
MVDVPIMEDIKPPGKYQGYLEQSSSPLTCFFFALPLFLVYHGGLWWMNSFTDLRWANAADIAIAEGLNRLGMAGPLLSFLFVVMTFLVIHALSGKPWVRPGALTLFLMIFESFVFALPVFMLSRLVLHVLDSVRLSAAVADGGISWQANLILSCGAGVYEEFLFRLVLMGLIILFLARALWFKGRWVYVFAALVQALVFSASHHLPGSPEAIMGFADFHAYLPVFVFRTVAGLYFAFVYLERGFGIAAGSHAAYDLLVMGLDLFLPGAEVL